MRAFVLVAIAALAASPAAGQFLTREAIIRDLSTRPEVERWQMALDHARRMAGPLPRGALEREQHELRARDIHSQLLLSAGLLEMCRLQARLTPNFDIGFEACLHNFNQSALLR